VDQNGSLQVYASAGLLSAAYDTDPVPPPDPDRLAVGTMIENPRHGSVTINNADDGSFTYTPNPGFVGRDYFTWQVTDGSKQGDYATVFIDVQPLTVTISVNNLKPRDPSAQVPNDQFPPDANGDPQYATLNLGVPGGLPDGSTVTLSVNSDVQTDLDVYDGIPGQSGTNLLFGKDAGSDSYTWNIIGSQTSPSTVYAVGLAGTDYDQAVFTLSVAVAQQTLGTAPPGNTPGPQNQPIAPTTQATVPGKGGFLEAFDGTNDGVTKQTDVRKFYLGYNIPIEQKKYHRGIGNGDEYPLISYANAAARAKAIAFGDSLAQYEMEIAYTQVEAFYNASAQNRDVPLDMVGYSRGSMEAVALANLLSTTGIAVKNTDEVVTMFHPTIRYMGLISPVRGPFEAPGIWPTTLPRGVIWMYQALDSHPNSMFLPEHQITAAAGTQGVTYRYRYKHTAIGYSNLVLQTMEAQGVDAGAPI
jgi:hypothetical protein